MSVSAKILLVDDYPPLLKHYASWLGQHCSVATAANADEALAILDREPIDIVIADQRMPGESGLWLLDQVRKRSGTTGRVLMSAVHPPEIEEHLSSGLVQRFLTEPFTDEALLECLTRKGAPERAQGHGTAPRARVSELTAEALDAILTPERLRAVFQPIFAVTSQAAQLHAIEGLIRGPSDGAGADAEVLFHEVRRHERELAADRACVTTIIRAASTLPETCRLSLNVHASTLAHDRDFPSLVAREAEEARIAVARLIVEIVEYAPEWVGDRFLTAMQELRAMGACIAVDDVGAGSSNYRKILDCCPEYIKIDRYFVAGCHADFRRQAVLESIAMLAPRFNSRVIAEGVETSAELALVVKLGIDLVQGFLLARPMPVEALLRADFVGGAQIPLSIVNRATQTRKEEQK